MTDVRQPGYYWVRRERGQPLEIAEWRHGYFFFEDDGGSAEDFYWIGERIEEPTDARE